MLNEFPIITPPGSKSNASNTKSNKPTPLIFPDELNNPPPFNIEPGNNNLQMPFTCLFDYICFCTFLYNNVQFYTFYSTKSTK